MKKTFVIEFENDANIVEEDIEDALREYIHDSLDKDMQYEGEITVSIVEDKPILSEKEFTEKYKGRWSDCWRIYQGYLLGSKSIPEMTDEEICKCPNPAKTCTDDAKWCQECGKKINWLKR